MTRPRTAVAVLMVAAGMTAAALLGGPLSGHVGRGPATIAGAAALMAITVMAVALIVRRRRAGWLAALRELKARGSDVGRAARLLARFTKGEHKTFRLALVLLTFEAATAVFEWYPLAYLIDYLKGDRGPLPFLDVSSQRTATVALLTAAIVLIAIANSAADSLAEIFLARGGRTLGFRLRVAMFSHLQRLSLAFHDRSRKGDVTFRVVGDVKEFESFVIDSLSDLAGSILLLVATITFIAFQSWQVALVGLTIVPVLAVISNYFAQRIKAAAKRQRAREGDLASATQEMLNSIRVVQAFGRGGHDEQQFVEHSGRAMAAALEAARLEALFSGLVSVAQALSIALVIWIGLWLIDQGTMTVGMLVLLTVLIGQMFKPTRKIIKQWNTIAKVLASVDRIRDLLDREVTVRDEPGAVPAPALRGSIEFRDVSFAYQGAEPNDASSLDSVRPTALSRVSFTIEPGEVVALSGHSGAGKSTVAQLIPRLYDPQQGAVLLDGRDVREFTLDSVRSQVSMVLQDTVLLSGTIAENIAYGQPEATREQIVAAATRANADEFIEKLPDGYETDLSEQAVNLSGGQRQRIAIARALIRRTPILVLDEPTAGLDADSAELVLTGLRELMRDKTTLVISHDLSLIGSADRILVLQSGIVVESGTHEELLERGGPYAQLHGRHGTPDRPAIGSSNGDRASDLAVLDPLASPQLLRELPALVTALDESAMKRQLEAMVDQPGHRWVITRCDPGKALYVPGEGCLVRYRLSLRGANGGGTREALVGGRLFSNSEDTDAFVRDRLAPLAEQARSRDEVAPFGRPVAGIETLAMATYAFPIDAELPTLIDATDSDLMLERFRDSLGAAFDDGAEIEACRIRLAHYPRRGRCSLRYELDARRPSRSHVSGALYGKIGANGWTLAEAALTALRERELMEGGRPIRIPRPLGTVPELDLALVEAIPGRARIPALVAKRAERQLEDAIDTCAGIAVALHTSGIELGPVRTIADEFEEVARGVDVVRRLAPALGARLDAWTTELAAHVSQLDELPPGLSHGDYTPRQVLFGHGGAGVVDLDDVCQAEPPLDLGRFAAYLRLACRKGAAPGSSGADLGDALCRRFLRSYAEEAGIGAAGLPVLRVRVDVYEALSLARIALHSWCELKPMRTAMAMGLLEERMACLPRSVH